MADHPGRYAVTEEMGRAATLAAQADPGESVAHNMADGGRACKAGAGRVHAQKDLSRHARAPVLAQVESQGFSNVREQGKTVLYPALAAGDDFSTPPENVVELQGGYFSRTQPEPCEKEQNRVIPPSAWRRPVSSRKDAFHLVGREKGGYLSLAPFTDRGN